MHSFSMSITLLVLELFICCNLHGKHQHRNFVGGIHQSFLLRRPNAGFCFFVHEDKQQCVYAQVYFSNMRLRCAYLLTFVFQVRALRKLRADMSSLSRWILGQMCDELESRIYDLDSVLPITSPNSTGLIVTKSSALPAKAITVRSASGKAAGTGLADIADDVNDSFKVISTQLLVACLAQVDGVVEAKTFLHYNMRAEVNLLETQLKMLVCNCLVTVQLALIAGILQLAPYYTISLENHGFGQGLVMIMLFILPGI